MALLCISCRAVVPGTSYCSACGCQDLYCGDCRQVAPPGVTSCPRCRGAVLVRRAPDLPDLSIAVPRVSSVPSSYQAGRYGIEAEVTVPEGDVRILNDLVALVPLLHALAGQLAQLTIPSDHSRKLARDMRVLAADAAEEVELRRGHPT